MTRPAILAIDQGTTNTKALLVGLDGAVLKSATLPMGVRHPQPGWAEQSAIDIRDGVAATVAEIAQGEEILAIGISNQRETVLAWDARTSEPVGPAIIWQCRRSSDVCNQLRKAGHEALIRERTGLGLDPLFSASKLRWLIENVPEANALIARNQLRAGTVDSWLLWNLTGGAVHATDASNASRTQLLSLDSVAWDAEMLALFGVPAEILPVVLPSDSLFGRTIGGFGGLPDGIPIHAMLGDSHAALFGHGISGHGQVKVTLGTGSSLMCPTGQRKASTHGLSETIAWAAGGKALYAFEGNITVSGQAAAFASEILGLAGPDALTALALTVPDNGGVHFVPALAGMGAPHWKPDARGIISGLSLASKPAHIARAALEAIAHQICDVIEAIEADLAHAVQSISVDGGAARNDLLLQMLADLSARQVLRPGQSELSAFGAARLAGLGIGQSALQLAIGMERQFQPGLIEDARKRARAAWSGALKCCDDAIGNPPDPSPI